jgi:CheY-like chemotaxis protein
MTDRAKQHLLVVEDEPDGQEVVRSLLEFYDMDTDVVGTGEDAINLLSRRSYAAVVIDLALPGMDGMQLLATVRENKATADLPCIAVTAFHSTMVKQQALEAGFNAYFPKPIDHKTFVQELGKIIARS